jgi:hypothetical protein
VRVAEESAGARGEHRERAREARTEDGRHEVLGGGEDEPGAIPAVGGLRSSDGQVSLHAPMIALSLSLDSAREGSYLHVHVSQSLYPKERV